MLCPRWKDLSTLGFAIAVVADDGSLVAWGWGVPPVWCDSASAAEAWALASALNMTMGPIRVVTDCLGLLKTAEMGSAAANAPSMKLARTWAHISARMGGRMQELIQQEIMVWMPAHKSTASIGASLKSDNKAVTSKAWRANRLVDGLAKLAAADGAASKSTVLLIESAEVLVRHAAAQLGTATYYANNCAEEYVKDDGTVGRKSRRDAMDQPTSKTLKHLKPLAATGTHALDGAELTSNDHTDSSSERGHQENARRRRKAGAAACRKERQLHNATAARAVKEAAARATLAGETRGLQRDEATALLSLAAACSSTTHNDAADCAAPLPAPPKLRSEPTHSGESRLSRYTAPALRERPPRGQSSTTAAACRAAVDSLLGRS